MLSKFAVPGFLLVTLLTLCSMAVMAQMVTDFTLPIVTSNGLSGQTITLSSFRGSVVLVEFMEPWCPHCQNMAPVLEKLYKQFGSGNVVFLSVAGPYQGATAQDTARFIKNYGSSWSYVYDSSGSVWGKYGVNSTPTFFIVGKDGSIVAKYRGEQSYDRLAAALTATEVQQPAVNSTSISTSTVPANVVSATTPTIPTSLLSATTITSISNQAQTIGLSMPADQFYGGLGLVFAVLFVVTLAFLLKRKRRSTGANRN